jgi:hypothetical protein
MFTRLAVGTASLLALAFATATPAGATGHTGPTFPAGSEFVCEATAAGGVTWNPWIRVSRTGADGVSAVEYSIRPDARSTFAMPTGTGRIQAVSYTELIDDEVIFESVRAGVPASERRDCSYPFPSGAITIRGEIRYLTPPVRPTYAQIQAFCDANADNPAFSEYERATCVTTLSAAAGVSPGTK